MLQVPYKTIKMKTCVGCGVTRPLRKHGILQNGYVSCEDQLFHAENEGQT